MNVTRVWLKRLDPRGELAAVGATIGGKTAGTLVVAGADGEPLARHLLATPVVAAARKVVERHRGPGDLSSMLDTIDDLAAAIEATDAAEFRGDDPRGPLPEGAAEPLVVGRPELEIDRALRLLYYGDAEAHEGHSFFSAVAVAGVAMAHGHPSGELQPLAFGAFNGAQNRRAVAAWRRLAAQLHDMAETLDRQLAVVDARLAPSPSDIGEP